MQIRRPKEKSGLDEIIDNLHEEMLTTAFTDDKFPTLTKQLDELTKIKSNLKKDENKVSKETLWAVGGNLAGILLILNFERANAVTSKALSFVTKTKI